MPPDLSGHLVLSLALSRGSIPPQLTVLCMEVTLSQAGGAAEAAGGEHLVPRVLAFFASVHPISPLPGESGALPCLFDMITFMITFFFKCKIIIL